MLKVHLADGQTLSFDLGDEEQARKWLECAASARFQAAVTGLALQHNGVQIALPRPRGFSTLFMFAEHVDSEGRAKEADRVICYAGDVGVTATAHSGQRSVRVDVAKCGQLRYNPLTRSKR